MSGGSHNYLCYKDSDNITDHINDIEGMRDRLTELGFIDAAKETEELICIINAYKVRMETRIDRLNKVWKSVEWYDSSDSGLESVKQAVIQYREA
jgi:hypothetical protein